MERKLLISPKGSKCLDLTNQKFNHITLLSPIWDKRRSDGTVSWLCRCDCGQMLEAGSTDARRGNIKSCGCVKGQRSKAQRNLGGQRFGKLVVVRIAEKREHGKKEGAIFYLCQCDCGKTHYTTARRLIEGACSSCGCFRKVPINRNPDRKDAICRLLYSQTMGTNKPRGITTDITLSHFKELISSDCSYCGRKPSNFARDIYGGKIISNTVLYYSGLDQILPGSGYVAGNVRTCCFTCNAAKQTLSEEEFFIQMKKWSKNFSHLFDSLPDDFEYIGRYKSLEDAKELPVSQSFMSDEECEYYGEGVRRRVLALGEYEPSI